MRYAAVATQSGSRRDLSICILSCYQATNPIFTTAVTPDALYQQQLDSVLSHIEIAINSQMEAINEEITGGEYNAPRLSLNAFNSYDFEMPRDTGTGTNHRGMIMYDLAIAQNTTLPAIAHDSIMFDSMSRTDLSNLIRVYNDQVEKQIFIAVDKISDCTEQAKAIIKRTMVLKLDNNEHALFGEKWSRKDRP